MFSRRDSGIGVHKDLEHGPGKAFGSIDNRMAWRVPAYAVQHSACAVEDRVPAVGDSLGLHSYAGKP